MAVANNLLLEAEADRNLANSHGERYSLLVDRLEVLGLVEMQAAALDSE